MRLTQGRGPSLDAAHHAAMTLVPGLTAVAPSRWPDLPPAVLGLGAHAVIAVPPRIGIVSLGVLTGHRAVPGPLTADTLVLADILAGRLTGLAARPGASAALLDHEPGLRLAELHQAAWCRRDSPPAGHRSSS
ncbi:hypothetical protein ACH427_30695 [Streptomyces sp. NPDC020379]|uniref:hypothetical protein n=1 Tax=Streptomyces sp. NPDC020379 TaxID=3365071 RepID=UPI0037B3620D